MIEHYKHKGSASNFTIIHATLCTLQLAFAVVVAGLYGADLARATAVGAHAHPHWVYAEVVAALSALTCIVHLCSLKDNRVVALWCVWDWVLFVLWVAQFGAFGTIYLGGGMKEAEYEGVTRSVLRMRVAVWIDLVNMLLWFATAVLGIAWCIGARRMTRRTDRLELSQVEEEGGMNEDKLEEVMLEQEGYEFEPPKYDG